MNGESLDMILQDVQQIIVPGLTHWAHPGFFAYFNSSAATAATLGDWVASIYAVNGMMHKTSPSATELEERVADWLRQMIRLPDTFSGAITDSASVSILMAMLTARELLPNWNVRELGLSGRKNLKPLVVYTSEHGHSSIEKAAIIAGVGQANVRKIKTDNQFRMNPAELEAAILSDVSNGFQPLCVVSTIGTTSASSIDSTRRIGQICRSSGVYYHVDGAYGAMAAIVPELNHVLDGIEYADSLNTNPHKWLFCPLACGAFFTKHVEALKSAFQVMPEYLRGSNAPNNFMDWGPHLSRQFRSLKLWFAIRHIGVEGLIERIRDHVAMATDFASWIDESEDWQLMAPVPLGTVCFRANPIEFSKPRIDLLNEAILNRVNAGGEIFISHTKLNGQYTLRLSVGNVRTTERHVANAWRCLQEALDQLKQTTFNLP